MNTSFVGLLKGLLIALLLGLGLGAHAQQLEVTTPTELRATPATNGKVVTRLVKGSKLEQIEAQVGWIKVKFGELEGWVRLNFVKTMQAAAPAAAPASAGTGNLANLFAGGGNRPTASTGTKGITPEQLANAQPDPVEMAQLEKYAINMGQAEAFARSGRVVAQRIDAYTGAEK
ncbi:SH3 domain-containing protein [Acidovorax sp.]|uniref:SH3 domain-containing protein n=1 Tax=Acidovorax sp. TaxID=1872122 RepID=UPI003D036969